MDLATVAEAVRAGLPPAFPALQLTFHHDPLPLGEFAIIGNDGGTDICVELEIGGVFSIDARGKLPVRYINGSLDQLARSIAAYSDYTARVALLPEPDARALVLHLRNQFHEIDPTSLATPETWWSVVFEQAQDGLL